MKQILPRIWQWSWFSEEKQLDFNGHLLAIGEHKILVDPPPMESHGHGPGPARGAGGLYSHHEPRP